MTGVQIWAQSFDNEVEEALFYAKWVEKNAGKTRNRAKGAEGRQGAPGRPASAGPGSSQKPAKSLFSK